MNAPLVLKNKIIIIAILIMIFYVVIALHADIEKISEQFWKIKIELVVIILLLEVSSIMIRSVRQQQFLNNIGIKFSFIENFKLCLVGMSMIITPGGAGMLIKSHFLKKNHGEPISKTYAVVFAERYHELLAALTILIITLSISYVWQSALVVVFVSILLIVIYIIARKITIFNNIQTKILQIKYLNKIIHSDFRFNYTSNSLTDSRIMLVGWITSVIAFIFDAMAVYIGFLSFNVDFGILYSTQIFFTSIILGTLSFLPGGVGATEGIFIGSLLSKGLELTTASALVLFIRLTTIWFATMLGFLSIHFALKTKKQYNNSDVV